jgi:hypothetical protein
MASKLEQFLTSKKIDRRQLLAVSKSLEGLKPEDRAIKLAKRRGKVEGAEGAKETRKPRSGRALLAKKKQPEVTLADLFDFAKKE